MKLLTRWDWDKMTTICISFPNTFFRRLKKILQFVLKGAVNYKSKLAQAMAWHREDTKPLPESVVIQANGAYMSLSDWLSWLLHIYPYGEKRYCLSTRGIPSPPLLIVGNSDPSGWVGARDGLTIFCKIPTLRAASQPIMNLQQGSSILFSYCIQEIGTCNSYLSLFLGLSIFSC